MARKSSGVLKGVLSRHPDGYGFVSLEGKPGNSDVFVPPSEMSNALHGDQVLVELGGSRRPSKRRPSRQDERREGRIVQVVSRSGYPVVGKVFAHRKKLSLRPLDPRHGLEVDLIETDPGLVGKIAAASLVLDPRGRDHPFGRIAAVLGEEGDPGIQHRIVCYSRDIPMGFTQSVLRHASLVTAPSEESLEGRWDLRGLATFTIDPETARDHDDAVSLEESGEGFRLGVHIADVSHYVRLDDPVDQEAFSRGTSVYFPDQAIPMLPESLSSDLCSLRPEVDRLTLSVFMTFDPQGRKQGIEVGRSIIRSRARLTYEQVHRFLDADDRTAVPSELHAGLRTLSALASALRRDRIRDGAIDLDMPEALVRFDSRSQVKDIVKAPRYDSHRLIEEFMLVANVSVAEFLSDAGCPSIFRIHEPPEVEDIERFQEAASPFGYRLRYEGGKIHPRDYQRLLEKMQGKPELSFLSYALLRSMQQARYDSRNRGHFGLSFRLYTHFTSPIRRYPDLVVHRLIKIVLKGRQKTAPARHYFKRLGEIAERSSLRERIAMDAEREIVRWMRSEFMVGKLGEEYAAQILRIRPNGFFVELESHFVEGFVPVETLLDDFYIFRKGSQSLVGRQRKKVFRLGDKVRVRVDRVDRQNYRIDFSVIG